MNNHNGNLNDLQAHPLFSDLTHQEIDELYHVMKHVHLQVGDILCTEGEPSDCVFFVLSNHSLKS